MADGGEGGGAGFDGKVMFTPDDNDKHQEILTLAEKIFTNNVAFFADRNISPVDAAYKSIDAAHVFWHIWQDEKKKIQLCPKGHGGW